MVVAAAAVLVYGSHHEIELASVERPVEAEVIVEHDTDVKMVCRSELVDICWPAIVHGKTGRLIVQDATPWQVELPGKVHRWRRGDLRLQAHPDGRTWAVQASQGPWRAVYAGDHGHGFVYGKVPTTPLGDVDWAAVPSFNEAAPRLYRRATHEQRLALLSDIRDRSSRREFRRFMVKVAGMRPRGTLEQRLAGGAWEQMFQTLPYHEQKRIVKKMRRAFLRRDLANYRLTRTLRLIDIENPRVLRRIDRILAKTPQTFGHRRRAEALMLRALMQHDPQAAARHACRMASHLSPADLAAGGANAAAQLREAILVAIASGPASCEPVQQAWALHDGDARFASLGHEAAARVLQSVRASDPLDDLWQSPVREVPAPHIELLLQAAATTGGRCGN